jgi:putative endonuclease
MTSRQATGQYGQDHAIQFLKTQHYAVIDTNWRCIGGEIDIIAQDETGIWVFVEVRTRHAPSTEAALMSITPRKRQRMVHAAYAYLHAHELPDDTAWRVDVIAVALSGQSVIIDYVEDALDWTT